MLEIVYKKGIRGHRKCSIRLVESKKFVQIYLVFDSRPPHRRDAKTARTGP